MQELVIEGKKRESVGKKDTALLRKADRVPCVLYGGEAPVHFHASDRELEKLVHTPEVFIFIIDIDGKKEKAVLQDVQYHPVGDQVLHMDFIKVNDDVPITLRLPVKLNGNPEGVLQGGKLQVKLRKLKVKGFVKDLPEKLDIDISKVSLGQSVKIETLNFDNIEILDPKNAVVCAVKLTRSAIRGAQLAGTEEA